MRGNAMIVGIDPDQLACGRSSVPNFSRGGEAMGDRCGSVAEVE